jgi:hypothetical protein
MNATVPQKTIPVIDAARRLGVTRSYVTRLLRRKRLVGVKITSVVWGVDANSIEKYLRSGKCT